MKPQTVRLLDVFVFGPFMLYLSTQRRTLTRDEKALLALLAVGTVGYNLINYFEHERAGADNGA